MKDEKYHLPKKKFHWRQYWADRLLQLAFAAALGIILGLILTWITN